MLFLTAAALVLWRTGNPACPDRRDRLSSTVRAFDVAIVILAIVSYWGAISPKFILRLGGIRLLSVSSSDIPFALLLILVFVRLWIRRPEAWRGGLRLPVASAGWGRARSVAPAPRSRQRMGQI